MCKSLPYLYSPITINKHEVRYLCPHWRLSAKANQRVCDLDLFSRAIVNQMNLFAFQLTDSLFNMSDHLLHATRLISISASSKEEHEQSVSNPSIRSPIVRVPAVFCSTRSNGTETARMGQQSITDKHKFTPAFTHLRKSTWPARLWTAGNCFTQRRSRVMSSQVYLCSTISHEISLWASPTHNNTSSWPGSDSLRSKREASSKKLLKNKTGNLWRRIQREAPILLRWWRGTGLKPDIQLEVSGNIRTLTWTLLSSSCSDKYQEREKKNRFKVWRYRAEIWKSTLIYHEATEHR